MSAKIEDLSAAQKQTLLLLSKTKGYTTKEVGEHLKMKNPTAMLSAMRERGLVRAVGHYSPSRSKWMLTDEGIEMQKKVIKALPN
jgi:DNA-binding MarR family transcriptional regulator